MIRIIKNINKSARFYHKRVIDHYENPRNVGSLDKTKKNVGTGLVGAPACGDVMKIQIEVDDKGTIIDTKFKTFGCLAGDVKIATPKGYVQIKSLSVSDIVYAWNDFVTYDIEKI